MNIILVGANGVMGHVLREVSLERNINIVCGVEKEEDLSGDFPIYDDFSKIEEDGDLIIDFSIPDNIENILDFALEKNLPLVLATTGYSEKEEEMIIDASKSIPILKSGNMSLGVNLMKNLVKEMTKVLKDFDIEIIEAHHNKKVDAPSGTAKMLLDNVEDQREVNRVKYGRNGRDEKRQVNDVGIHSIRGGSVVGEHSVLFLGNDEILEIRHTALSKKIFANGALDGGEFIVNMDKGLYTMDDVIG